MDSESAVTTCHRRPAAECRVRRVRCARHICPDRVHEASVGHPCPERVKEGARAVRQARTAAGARRWATPLVTYALTGDRAGLRQPTPAPHMRAPGPATPARSGRRPPAVLPAVAVVCKVSEPTGGGVPQ
ncbi:hypothetical protein ACF1HU_13480 [Streptomyces olivaceus]|uniref:hypothetical protein n=1 Tax=Streptomyces olivaceus TaxID=47716 RepID=UPI0004CBB3E9|nr:hypothetical protein [Streptomyces olivaceus]